jgi:LuxR family maltose regulon positive regulatory protein
VRDAIRAVLLNEIKDHRSIAKWLQNADFGEHRLPAPAVINVMYIHLSYLMHQGEYARLIGAAQAVLPKEGLGQPLREALILLLMAASHVALQNRAEAARWWSAPGAGTARRADFPLCRLFLGAAGAVR